MAFGGFFFLTATLGPWAVGADAEGVSALQEGQGAHFRVTGDRRVYHYAYLVFQPYLSHRLIEYPEGDLDPRRAFYWGRVLGTDGIHVDLRQFNPQLEDNLMAQPPYANPTERESMQALMTRFQTLYARYGCDDNIGGFYMDAPREGQSLEDFRAAVDRGTRQRMELFRAAGLPRVQIDLEWSNLQQLREAPYGLSIPELERYAYEVGRTLITAVRETYPQVRFGFYPGLTGIQYNLERREAPATLRGNSRLWFLRGIYDHRGPVQLFHFAGWTYSANHLCTGDRWWTINDPPYVHDTYQAVERILYAHESLLGPDLEYVWGRWDLAHQNHARYHQPGRAVCKLANVPPEVLERTWKILFERGDGICVWDHWQGWDEDGGNRLTVENEEQWQQFLQFLEDTSLVGHRLYDTVTHRYWCPGVEGPGRVEEKLRLFEINERDGVKYITGRLDPQFVTYVNLVNELSGHDRETLPLYTADELRWAREYQERGFFPFQEIVEGSATEGVAGYLKPRPKERSVLGHEGAGDS